MERNPDVTFEPQARRCLAADFKEVLHQTNRQLASLRFDMREARRQNRQPSVVDLTMERELSQRARMLHKGYLLYK